MLCSVTVNMINCQKYWLSFPTASTRSPISDKHILFCFPSGPGICRTLTLLSAFFALIVIELKTVGFTPLIEKIPSLIRHALSAYTTMFIDKSFKLLPWHILICIKNARNSPLTLDNGNDRAVPDTYIQSTGGSCSSESEQNGASRNLSLSQYQGTPCRDGETDCSGSSSCPRTRSNEDCRNTTVGDNQITGVVDS